MSSLTHWITSSTSMGTSSGWASPLTTGERGGAAVLASDTAGGGRRLLRGFGGEPEKK